MMVVVLIRNFHFKFEGIPTIFIATINKKLNFSLYGPFSGTFRYHVIAKTS